MLKDFKILCNVLPFYMWVKAARFAFTQKFDNIFKVLLEIIVYGVVLYLLSVMAFKIKMKSDQK